LVEISADDDLAVLTVTARGQVTFRKDVLQHLGIEPGGKLQVDLLPDGRAELRADKPKGSVRDLQGFLRGKTNGRQLTIEEIEDAISESGSIAGKGRE
jgi:bifunctional DNA-binding transcriptional regulator/antitoxin component of YhaV-PrlF toxin-antitoxin module